MSGQDTLTTKEELIQVLQEFIEVIKECSNNDITKRKTTMNVEHGIGYFLTKDKYHGWIVKLDEDRDNS